MVSLYVRHFCACALYSHERFCLNKESQSNDGSQQDRCELWRPGEHGWEGHCRCSVGGSSAVTAVIALRCHRAVNTRGMCARYTSLRAFPLQRRVLRVGNSPQVEAPEKVSFTKILCLILSFQTFHSLWTQLQCRDRVSQSPFCNLLLIMPSPYPNDIHMCLHFHSSWASSFSLALSLWPLYLLGHRHSQLAWPCPSGGWASAGVWFPYSRWDRAQIWECWQGERSGPKDVQLGLD